jgi:hypothetical protein
MRYHHRPTRVHAIEPASTTGDFSMTTESTRHSSPTSQDHSLQSGSPDTVTAPRKQLTPAAQRALAEAEERRAKALQDAQPSPKELQGPQGPEPTRYGDWERKGIASDF